VPRGGRASGALHRELSASAACFFFSTLYSSLVLHAAARTRLSPAIRCIVLCLISCLRPSADLIMRQFMLPVLQNPSHPRNDGVIAHIGALCFDMMKLAVPSLVVWCVHMRIHACSARGGARAGTCMGVPCLPSSHGAGSARRRGG
jgi:hypothetical protein